jgi:hypothetical protein
MRPVSRVDHSADRNGRSGETPPSVARVQRAVGKFVAKVLSEFEAIHTVEEGHTAQRATCSRIS